MRFGKRHSHKQEPEIIVQDGVGEKLDDVSQDYNHLEQVSEPQQVEEPKVVNESNNSNNVSNIKSKKQKRNTPKMIEGVKIFHGPIRFNFFKFPVYISTAKQIGFFAALVVVVVMAFSTYATVMSLNYNNEMVDYYRNQIVQINNNNELYTDMIAKSNANEEGYYSTVGYFRSEVYSTKSSLDAIYKYDSAVGSDLYYIKFVIEINGLIYENKFETMPIYVDVLQDIKSKYASSTKYAGKHTFNIVYTLGDDGKVNYAINSDYAGTIQPLIDDCNKTIELYEQGVDIAIISIAMLGVIMLVFFALMILLIIRIIQHSKRVMYIERAKEQAEFSEAKSYAETISGDKEKKYKFCDYCGAKMEEGAKVCLSCGSKWKD